MSNIALETKTKEQEFLKNYLQENASEVLANKINNGVKIEKDGKTLINKKTFDTFMNYATDEAKKQVESGARCAMIDHRVVCGWLMHYFEEDTIEGILYNEDGTVYKKPTPKPKKSPTSTTPIVKPEIKKEEPVYISMFEGVDDIFQTSNDNGSQKDIQFTHFSENDQIKTNNDQIEIEKPDIEFSTFEPPTEDSIFSPPDEEISTFEPPTENSLIFSPPVEENINSKHHKKYMKYQNKYPNLIVILRLGDFYEILGENAVTIGNLLNMTITGRLINDTERTPLIGFPYHSFDAYLNKIIKHFSVVVIENENEENVYDKIEKVENSDTFVQVSTGEIIDDDFDFDIEIVAKIYDIFGADMEAC